MIKKSTSKKKKNLISLNFNQAKLSTMKVLTYFIINEHAL